MICPTYPQFETFVRVTLDAMIDPLQRARGSGQRVEGVIETAASILATVARDSFGTELGINDALASLDIKRKVYDYMDLIEQPGDENTPEPIAPDFAMNVRAFVRYVKAVK